MGKNDYYMKIGGINGTNNYYMKIGGINDYLIKSLINDYYTLIVAFLTKQIQNRYRYRRLPDSHVYFKLIPSIQM